MQKPFIHDFDLAIGTVFGLPVYWYGAVYTVGFLGVFGWFAILAHVVNVPLILAMMTLIGATMNERSESGRNLTPASSGEKASTSWM